LSYAILLQSSVLGLTAYPINNRPMTGGLIIAAPAITMRALATVK
jgi:ABC-type protease/lipase transport system fused ATPase/permease subunit